ncbi:energy transducer TonB [Haloferula sp. BvORR071]|uniref:energy transducer TonB n=1 Tax=Haloferula sp. BvORR071 TaxID=1396141 RepID=UPI00054DA8C4|nr:energy transducer TonB [Haloferula sp. BvORR071]
MNPFKLPYRFLPLLAALALPSCGYFQMTSTSIPPVVGTGASMPGSVGHQMAMKAEMDFPREGWIMRSYEGRSVDYPEPEYTPSPCYPVAYTPIAKEKDVWVAIVVGRDGRVKKADCMDMNNSYFARTIEHTVKKWTFRPGTVDGSPEEFLITATIKYRMNPTGIL